METISRPKFDEYDPFYQGYIDRVEDDQVVQALRDQIEVFREVVKHAEEASQKDFRYEEGKWSLLELLVHMVDTERVMSFRCFCLARDNNQVLPNMDQNEYIKQARCENRSLSSVLTEFESLRKSNIEMINALDEEVLENRGIAGGNSISVRALIYIMIGHLQHHFEIINERYFK
ncbi:DinB family protein [Marinoscillum sp. MHG1-6]|uniref:DinB family protein n=1 Tax=Marinoscillum sp. MHG1-6 TaxID=2959627 RepID=UPI0021579A0B|nr:DinB family protein [Marinoscillum sp. MHG1-6]